MQLILASGAVHIGDSQLKVLSMKDHETFDFSDSETLKAIRRIGKMCWDEKQYEENEHLLLPEVKWNHKLYGRDIRSRWLVS